MLGQFFGTIFGRVFGTILGQLLPYHFFAFPPPAIPIEVNTGWGTEKSFFVAVGFLSHFGVKHYYDHVATFAQVLFHCISCQTLVFRSEKQKKMLNEMNLNQGTFTRISVVLFLARCPLAVIQGTKITRGSLKLTKIVGNGVQKNELPNLLQRIQE